MKRRGPSPSPTNGIGMTKEELEQNLGTIARSGSLSFKNENEAKEDIDIIGQFGVGFYSAFMVSKRITVKSRAFGSDRAYVWESSGAEGYTLSECGKDDVGTEIVLELKDNTSEENYDEYLQTYRLKALVKKYSDYIRYPHPHGRREEPPERGEQGRVRVLHRDRDAEQHGPHLEAFEVRAHRRGLQHLLQGQVLRLRGPAEGHPRQYRGCLHLQRAAVHPEKTPYDYYTREFEKGLQLYSSGVLIMEKCADLLPDCFSFVKGLVDSQDLSLNISRELLQHDRQLKNIASRIEKKIKSELKDLLEHDREKYDKFYKAFGRQLKVGVYSGYGMNKELLSDLLMFYSSTEKKPVTFAEYIGRMQEGQKNIYYACGGSAEQIARLPQTELVQDKGFEVLYCTEDIDEFALRMLRDVDGKEFMSVSSDELNLASDEEKKELGEKEEESREMLDFLGETLEGKVAKVLLSPQAQNPPRLPLLRGRDLARDGEGPERHAGRAEDQGEPRARAERRAPRVRGAEAGLRRRSGEGEALRGPALQPGAADRGLSARGPRGLLGACLRTDELKPLTQ